MSGAAHWRKVCTKCGCVLGGYSLSANGTDYDAVTFFGKLRPNTQLDRLMPGDDGYPVTIDGACVHHGGSWVPADPNQGDLFGATQ